MLQVQNYNYPNRVSFDYPLYYGNPYYAPQMDSPGLSEGADVAKTAITAGLLQLVASSLNKVSEWLGHKLVNGKEFTNEENVCKVVKDMCDKHNLNIDVKLVSRENLPKFIQKYGPAYANEFAIVADGKNAFYSDDLKLAVAPKSKPALLPHEIGHAANAKNGFLKLLQKSRRYAVFAPAAALFASSLLPTRQDGKKNFVERNAGVLGFCAFLPTIAEEGLASLRGIKQAGKTLGKSINLGALKRNYLFAWATYLLAGIGLGISTKYAFVEDKLKNRLYG